MKNEHRPDTGAFPPVSERQVAVALAYDADSPAPHVAAKGWGEMAREILRVAEAHGVPVREDRDLAAVLSKLSLGQQIPEELYRAVAEVLAFIYRMNNKAGSVGA
ncbi:MAG: EscU/YscU/HrcU family type III secretion system export apparatus switch protein [Planctomycetota bacterium]